MAKKSRRARRRRASGDVARTGVAAGAKEESAKGRATGPDAGTSSGFAEQYAYVYGDLKRIAIIAGTLFAILVALSFVIG